MLDDICGEAQEVKRLNGFLAYGPPLHQLRELVSNVRTELKRGDPDALNKALVTYEAAVQKHREQIQQLLATESESSRNARRLRFCAGVFAVRTALLHPVLPPLKDGPPKRAKSGGDYMKEDAYIPEAFAPHYPTRFNARSRLRAEGHTDDEIKA